MQLLLDKFSHVAAKFSLKVNSKKIESKYQPVKLLHTPEPEVSTIKKKPSV